MKHKYYTSLLFALLLSLCNFSLTQQDYINYARQISNAESAVLHDKFVTAFEIYDQTFRSYEKCFPNDAFIAAQAAATQNNFAACFNYLKKGFEWGLQVNCLRYPAFKDFKLSIYNDSVSSIYSQQRTIYLNRINKEYRKECFQLYFRDQKANKTHRLLNILIPAFGRHAEKKLDDTCVVLIQELNKLIIRYNAFPSVVNTGVRDSTNVLVSPIIDGRDYWIPATLFWHYSFAFQENEEILLKALKEGNLSAWHYALIRDFAKIHFDNAPKKNKSKFKYTNFYYNVYWLNPNEVYNEELLVFFNSNRMNIGLMSIEDEQLKKKRSLSYSSYTQKSEIQENEKKYLIYFDYFYL